MKPTTPTNEHLLFFRKFLEKGKKISSFWPSSRTLAQALCRDIDPNKPQIILELGAGTGPVSVVASEKMHPESTLLSVEQDLELSQFLSKRCPKATVIHSGVEAMMPSIQALGIKHVDVIISTLPLSSMPREIVMKTLGDCQSLMQDLIVSQVTIVPWFYLNLYKSYFEEVDFEFILRSIPPGGIYRCRGLKS